jgi:branched-chain amino acid transport system permease protein
MHEVLVLLLASVVIGVVLALLSSPLLAAGGGFGFGMIHLALGQLVYVFAIQSSVVPGGSDGLFGVPRPTLLSLSLTSNTAFYYLCAAVLGIVVVVFAAFRRTMMGRVISGTRESRDRSTALGVSIWRYQTLALIVSACASSLAGCLYALQVGSISPDQLNWTQGATPVLAGLIGGIRTVAGPVLGAAIYATLQDKLENLTAAWQLWLGLAAVLIALVSPRGIMALFEPEARLRTRLPNVFRRLPTAAARSAEK